MGIQITFRISALATSPLSRTVRSFFFRTTVRLLCALFVYFAAPAFSSSRAWTVASAQDSAPATSPDKSSSQPTQSGQTGGAPAQDSHAPDSAASTSNAENSDDKDPL